jgi:hypothetical protein
VGYEGGSLTSLFDEDAQAATNIALRKMADRGGERFVELTRMNTPIDTGELRASWYQLPTNKTHFGPWPAWESGVATDVDYAPHVEYGTGLWGPKGSKYPIVPKTPGGVLHWIDRETGEHVFSKMVMHPGSPGQHMVAIAADVVEFEVDGGTLFRATLDEWKMAVEAGAD